MSSDLILIVGPNDYLGSVDKIVCDRVPLSPRMRTKEIMRAKTRCNIRLGVYKSKVEEYNRTC